jgi:hypothetical protein
MSPQHHGPVILFVVYGTSMVEVVVSRPAPARRGLVSHYTRPRPDRIARIYCAVSVASSLHLSTTLVFQAHGPASTVSDVVLRAGQGELLLYLCTLWQNLMCGSSSFADVHVCTRASTTEAPTNVGEAGLRDGGPLGVSHISKLT